MRRRIGRISSRPLNVMSRPSNRMRPAAGSSMRRMASPAADLPQPRLARLPPSSPGWRGRSAVDGQRRGQLLVARCEAAVAMLGIAVDLRARIERMAHAAHLMLDRKQHLAGIEGDDVLETVLVLIALLGAETPFPETAIGPVEMGEVAGEEMPIKV